MNISTKSFQTKRKYKKFFLFNFLFLFLICDLAKAEVNNFSNSVNNPLEIEYLESRNELEDYIIDTGDAILLEFFSADELSAIYPVNEEGELFLPRLDEVYVRGLTISELTKLLQIKYSEFLVEPKIKARIALFKSIQVSIRGEVRNPGLYEFPPYKSGSFLTLKPRETSDFDSTIGKNNDYLRKLNYSKSDAPTEKNIIINKTSENIITLSDVIRKAGGITPLTNLSRIEVIRDVPLGKGGGQKKAYIDFNDYVNESDHTYDIRIFDGDTLFFPALSKPNLTQMPRSILSGISPRFISVDLFGRVESPGTIRVPLQSSLSDVIDLSGPIKPLSGKIVLIRYNKDGTIQKKIISYSGKAKRGSKKNPFLEEGDLITVKNSILSTSSGVIREITEPFLGIYTTKQVLEGLSE